MFPLRDIKTVLNIKPAITEEMLNCIEMWAGCYSGNAKWLDGNIKSLNLEQSITREFANIVLNEMTINISNKNLNDIFCQSIKDINTHFPKGIATGSMVIKPLGESGVQYVPANAFIPIEYDGRGRLIKVIFPEFKQIEDRYYTRLEYHNLDLLKGLTITNTAYCSSSRNNLGSEIPLAMVDEWKNLDRFISYPLMKKCAFGYYRNPIANTIDGSKCGVSIFHNALGMIRLADIQFSRLDWEFESGERAIHVDITALNTENKLNNLNKRLYKGIDIDGGNADLFKEFSPILRQKDFIDGLEEYKRNIEFEVGLSYGDISNPQTIAKTATEIKSAKSRKYNTVNAIQQNLRDCLDDLCYALAFYNCMTKNYDFNCSFKDSILADEETERKQDLQDVSVGAMPLWEYRMKWYGEDEKTARLKISDNAEVIE